MAGVKLFPHVRQGIKEHKINNYKRAKCYDSNLPSADLIVRKNGDKVRVMVERDSKTLFVFNVFFSSMGDNHVGFNFNSKSMMANAEPENGTIEPVFDKESQKPGYVLNDYSNFGDKGFHTKEQIVEFFWRKMNETLEAQA